MDNCDYFVSQTAPEQYLLDRNKELTARIAELERKNAMLLNVDWFPEFFQRVCELSDRTSPDDEPDAIIANAEELKSCLLNTFEAIGSADTEAWLQAEIVKRLGKPVASMNYGLFGIPEFHSGVYPYKDAFPLYRLPSPLATPEERKE